MAVVEGREVKEMRLTRSIRVHIVKDLKKSVILFPLQWCSPLLPGLI